MSGDMRRFALSRGAILRMAVVLGMAGFWGCGTGATTGPSAGSGGIGTVDGGGVVGGPVIDGNRNGSAESQAGKTSGEPNDTFEEAIVAVFDGPSARLQGNVSRRNDIDVYLLGPLSRGDSITVDSDTDSAGSLLDISMALFDGQRRLVYNNDDRSFSDLDAFMSWVARDDSNAFYLVVSHSAFSENGRFAGAYVIDVDVVHGVPVPPPQAQTLVLDFDGGLVDSPTLGSVSVVPFNAGAISNAYTGQSDRLKQAIRESVEENFQGFNVNVVTTDDGPVPVGTEVSTIFLGGFDVSTFGIAENVDLYNVNLCDDAIIYTESFSPAQFSLLPSAASLAVAIGNVTAHEAGHLLGLNHVDDDAALMDDRSAADALLLDQEFMEAPVSTDIIPIGTQDAVLLLEDIVGRR